MARGKGRKDHDHDHDKHHKKKGGKPPPKKKKPGTTPTTPTTTSTPLEQLQLQQTQLPPGIDQYPVNPPNDEAAFSTGPGEAVQYDYSRQYFYSQDYATQVASGQTPGVPGPGQVTTG